MSICKKCGDKIPCQVIINDSITQLTDRLFCLTCSPFQHKNVRDLNQLEIDNKGTTHRTCNKCDTEKTVKHFYFRKDINRWHPWCKDCINTNTSTRQQANKQMAIEYKGGSCSICGYTKCVSGLEFHHIDPSNKEKGISKMLKQELDKCILVCNRCHREIHAGLVDISKI